MANQDDKTQEDKNKVTIQLNQVVCICNGIKLKRVLKGIKGCKNVNDVNKSVGTGCGGCKGQRCGPRIKFLLQKLGQLEETE